MPTPEYVTAGVWRFPLPSKTLPPFDHTNSYLVKRGEEAVLIDVGADDPRVLDTLVTNLEALGVTRLKALLLTHTHPDHCAGAAVLRERYSLKVYVHALEQPRLDFPTARLMDGDTFSVGGEHLGVHHTPGHSPGHLSFSLSDSTAMLCVFVGDLLAAQGSVWVGLPEGDVSDYLASLTRVGNLLNGSSEAVLAPGHGPLVHEAKARLEAVYAHRLAREAEVLQLLQRPHTLTALRAHLYPHVPAAMDKLVEGTLRAHLNKLLYEGRVERKGETFQTIAQTRS